MISIENKDYQKIIGVARFQYNRQYCRPLPSKDAAGLSIFHHMHVGKDHIIISLYYVVIVFNLYIYHRNVATVD